MRLIDQHCIPRRGEEHRLDATAADRWLAEIPGWQIQSQTLVRTFEFADFHATMAFVNRVAALANAEDHHPDLAVSYSRCTVAWNTHDVGGLSLNDFVCAAKTSQLA
jgi:4a-hydroxytetrahydrobiopterin dehydratase